MHQLRIFALLTLLSFSILANANAKPDPSSSVSNYTNPDLVFRLLLAEIASQRGELNLASELFLDLAKQTDSALLAERATRLTTPNLDFRKEMVPEGFEPATFHYPGRHSSN